MTATETRASHWKTALTAALVVVLLGLLAAWVAAADDTASRLDRKVRVMERVLEEVLVQSPDVAVSPGSAARGLYLDEFGALFVIEGDMGMAFGEDGPPEPEVLGPGEGSEKDAAEAMRAFEDWRKKSAARQRERLSALRTQLQDALVDYGATLAELRDDQWVALVVFLGERGPFGDTDGPERLMLKVRMRDLRQHAAGALSREAVVAKVLVTES
jgi:hypothetical protein